MYNLLEYSKIIEKPDDFVEMDDYCEFTVLDIKKIQALLERNIEMILYLFFK